MRTKRNNHEGNIRERKDGRWEVRITGGIDFTTGKKKRISKCVKTKTEAVEELQKSVYDIRVNGYKDPTTITLKDWYNFWLETYMTNSLKRSTYVSYEGYMRNHYGPAIGTVKLKNLTGVLLQDFYNFKVDEGLSPKTIRNMNLALHKCLDYAKKEGLVLNNASEMINLPRAEDKEIQVFSVEQQKTLMKLSYHHRYGIFVRLTLCTGLRLGELLGLSWSEVDLKGSSIKIVKTLNRLSCKDTTSKNKTEIVLDTPKSKNSKRIIPL
ncbi:MAG: site-specific integrase, partial [Clostridia bacterium]